MNKATTAFGLLLLLASGLAFATGQGTGAGSTDIQGVTDVFRNTALTVQSALIKPAIKTASAGALLSLLIRNWKDVFKDDLNGILSKLTGTVIALGVTFWSIDNLNILSTMFDGFQKLAGSAAGSSSSDSFDAGDVWTRGIILINNLDAAFQNCSGMKDGFLSSIDNLPLYLKLLITELLIFLAYGIIAMAVFMATLEFYMMFAVAPLAFSLFPTGFFRDQAMAPIKGIMAIGWRLIILAVIVRATYELGDAIAAGFEAKMTIKGFFNQAWMMIGGAAACAVAAFNAGKIAAAIASGSSNFHGTDALHGAAQIAQTAATGAGVAALAGAAALKAGGAAAEAGKSLASGVANALKPSELSMSPSSGSGTTSMGGPLPQPPFDKAMGASKAGQPQGNDPFKAGSQGSNAPGDGSSASIGGAEQGGGNGQQKESMVDRAKRLGSSGLDSMERMANHDAGQVSIAINTNSEG